MRNNASENTMEQHPLVLKEKTSCQHGVQQQCRYKQRLIKDIFRQKVERNHHPHLT